MPPRLTLAAMRWQDGHCASSTLRPFMSHPRRRPILGPTAVAREGATPPADTIGASGSGRFLSGDGLAWRKARLALAPTALAASPTRGNAFAPNFAERHLAERWLCHGPIGNASPRLSASIAIPPVAATWASSSGAGAVASVPWPDGRCGPSRNAAPGRGDRSARAAARARAWAARRRVLALSDGGWRRRPCRAWRCAPGAQPRHSWRGDADFGVLEYSGDRPLFVETFTRYTRKDPINDYSLYLRED